jgi:phosphoribosylglycinamide formyltransferase-1
LLGQAEVRIEQDDTPSTLEQRVLAAEHELYPRILSEFVQR